MNIMCILHVTQITNYIQVLYYFNLDKYKYAIYHLYMVIRYEIGYIYTHNTALSDRRIRNRHDAVLPLSISVFIMYITSFDKPSIFTPLSGCPYEAHFFSLSTLIRITLLYICTTRKIKHILGLHIITLLTKENGFQIYTHS